jgi:hypothetical protein
LMFIVSSSFIASFAVGDNINLNLETLRLFYTLSAEDSSKGPLLRKPITVILVSIAEAMVYDFISRIQSREYVTTVSPETVAALRKKDFLKLTNLIKGAKKFDLFKANDDFYEQLDELRKLRNRVHIQNERRHFERKEDVAFNVTRQRQAEVALEYIAKFLAAEHPRGTTTHGYVADFSFPWDEHWDLRRA